MKILAILVFMQTFLRLSKAQRDALAAAYSAHLLQVAALRNECYSIANKLQVCTGIRKIISRSLCYAPSVPLIVLDVIQIASVSGCALDQKQPFF